MEEYLYLGGSERFDADPGFVAQMQQVRAAHAAASFKRLLVGPQSDPREWRITKHKRICERRQNCMRRGEQPKIGPAAIKQRPHHSGAEGQQHQRGIAGVNGGKCRGRDHHLDPWSSNEQSEPTMEQPLKCKLLGERPERIKGKQQEDGGRQDRAAMVHRNRDQAGSDDNRTSAHGQQGCHEIVPSKAQIAPGMRAATDEVDDIGEEHQTRDEKRPTFGNVQQLHPEIGERHSPDEYDVNNRRAPRFRGAAREEDWASQAESRYAAR